MTHKCEEDVVFCHENAYKTLDDVWLCGYHIKCRLGLFDHVKFHHGRSGGSKMTWNSPRNKWGATNET